MNEFCEIVGEPKTKSDEILVEVQIPLWIMDHLGFFTMGR